MITPSGMEPGLSVILNLSPARCLTHLCPENSPMSSNDQEQQKVEGFFINNNGNLRAQILECFRGYDNIFNEVDRNREG